MSHSGNGSRLRRHFTFANVAAGLALFLALSGGAYAIFIPKNAIRSKHLAPNAAKGVDVHEATLGTVPSANRANTAGSATNATNAQNAQTVGGVAPEDLQFGNGTDYGTGAILDENETLTLELFDGTLALTCNATPDIDYDDVGGDPFDTDLWVDGAHQLVADGMSATTVPIAANDTVPVHIFGVAITIAQVSAHWDAGNTECAAAINAQENF